MVVFVCDRVDSSTEKPKIISLNENFYTRLWSAIHKARPDWPIWRHFPAFWLAGTDAAQSQWERSIPTPADHALRITVRVKKPGVKSSKVKLVKCNEDITYTLNMW